MTEQHPITPTPELLQQWVSESYGTAIEPGEASIAIATQAARWGADQELEACCEWLQARISEGWNPCHLENLRNSRRPMPPSPKEEALQVLENLIETRRIVDPEYQTLRHALEQLDD